MKIRKFDILLLLCLILFLIAGLWSYGRACQRAAAVLRDPGAAVLSHAFLITGEICLWISAALTLISGAIYIWDNRDAIKNVK